MSNELTPRELRRESDPMSLTSCETTEGISPMHAC